MVDEGVGLEDNGQMLQGILYKKYARYYEIIFADKDYKGEVKKLKALIKRYKKSPGKELLDVACGTGRHLEYLKNNFSCTGVDLYNDMLRIARKRVRGVRFVQGDMTTFRINKRFDIIVCLFNSIAYVKTLPKLRAAMKNFARHLKPGGVVIIEPYSTRAAFGKSRSGVSSYKSKGMRLVRVSASRAVGKKAIRKSVIVVVEDGKRLLSFEEGRNVGLFSVSETLGAMKSAGLRGTFLKQSFTANYGLYVGTKSV